MSQVIIPVKEREYVFTGVGLSVCVSVKSTITVNLSYFFALPLALPQCLHYAVFVILIASKMTTPIVSHRLHNLTLAVAEREKEFTDYHCNYCHAA